MIKLIVEKMMSEWISVEDQLPEQGVRVLTYSDGNENSWIMKITMVNSECKIIFNLKEYPNVCEDEFAKDICKIIEKRTLNLREDQWISVKDRLPEIEKEILYTDSKYNEIYLGIMSLDDELNPYFTHYDFLEDKGITHWMPLPNLPEMKDE
jgi:hypothetical protein